MTKKMFGNLDLSNPTVLISMFIGVSIAVKMIVEIFPDLISSLVSLSTMGNFSFGSFFASDGIIQLIVSAIVLFGVFALIGIKMTSGAKR